MAYPYLDELELIADWREDLIIRVARAQLTYEVGSGNNREEIIQLAAEAQEFKCVCRALKGLMSHV